MLAAATPVTPVLPRRAPAWITRLLELGIDERTRPELAKRIRLTNAMAFSFSTLTVFYVPVFILLGLGWLLPVLPVLSLVLGMSLWLNHARRFHLARLNYHFWSTAVVVAFAVLDRTSDVHLILIGLCTMPFIFYELKDRAHLAGAFAIPSLTFLVLQFFGPRILPEPTIDCGSPVIHITLLLIVLISVIHLCRANDLSESSLRGSLAKLEEETRARLQHERVATDEREKARVARAAGMAEIATGVLHNVGNILNSVNVSSCVIEERLRTAPTTPLDRAAALLRAGGAAEPEKAQQLAQYLEALAVQQRQEREELSREVVSLRKNVEHIHSVVATQQSFSKVVGVSEKVHARAVLEEALTLHAGSRERHRVALTVQHEELPEVQLDRHKVLQILVNLVRNAVDAMKEVDAADRRLHVRTGRSASGKELEFEVTDTGSGIAPENRVRIFQHGFTTKEDGHGFGLHASSCLAVEMHGTLSCHSDGPGRGSTFKLSLPLRTEG